MDKNKENIDKISKEIEIVEKMKKPLQDEKLKIERIRSDIALEESKLGRINTQYENDTIDLKINKNNILIFRLLKYFCMVMIIFIFVLSINSLDSSEIWKICYTVLGELAIGYTAVLSNRDLKDYIKINESCIERIDNYQSECEKVQDKINSLTQKLNSMQDKYPNIDQDLNNLNRWLDNANNLINELNIQSLSYADEIDISKEGKSLINDTYEEEDPNMPIVRVRKED